jgi:hypothetical protein
MAPKQKNKPEVKAHAVLGASNAYRWMVCPASVALCAQMPPQAPSEYAAQGTAAHEVIDFCFKHPGEEPKLPEVWADEETEAIQLFFDTVQADRTEGKYILENEVKFNLDRIMDGLYGTCDVCLLSTDLKKLKVYDYKHGAGVPVEVVDNKQLLYYALGAIQSMDQKRVKGVLDTLGWGSVFQEVEIVIVQPRCRHANGPVRRWIVSAETLDQFAIDLKKCAEATTYPKASFSPGEHCRFCAAQAICPVLADKALAVAQTDFASVKAEKVVTLPAPDVLTVKDLSKVLKFAPLLESWLKEVEAYALDCLQKGQEVPGFKLVKKRANRAWKSEEEAAEVLALYLSEDQMWEKKFTTPAKVDKLLKKDKKIVADLVTVPDNGNTIAPEYDPREPIRGSVAADFGKIEASEADKKE